MTRGGAARLAWSICAVIVASIAGLVVLSVLNRDTDIPGGSDADVLYNLALGAALVAVAPVGALVCSRRPGNPVGWILLGAAGPLALSGLANEYGVHALYTDPGGLPGGEAAAWLSEWVYIPSLLAMPALLFLLFPNGRLPGPRWRPVAWLVVLAAAAATVDAALGPTLDDAPFAGIANPLPFDVPDAALAPLSWVGWPGMTLGLILAGVAMISRLRRSRGVERQQLKWIATAAALLPLATLAGVATFYAGYSGLGGALVTLAFVPIPVAAGYAVLRHRLYDIDLVINRALVYGTLTAILAGAYVGLVLLLGVALAPLTNQSDLAIALSTLAVAALFQPVRRRVQTLVDRRFFRHKYDAARTLERFGARLRAETDLDALRAELTGVVQETMQPAHVSLWLREGGR
jgi:hypothetical protein